MFIFDPFFFFEQPVIYDIFDSILCIARFVRQYCVTTRNILYEFLSFLSATGHRTETQSRDNNTLFLIIETRKKHRRVKKKNYVYSNT